MAQIIRHGFAIIFISGFIFAGGCKFLNGSFESVSALDQAGKNEQAIQAYQDYLKKNPTTSLGPIIYYRIAKNYEAQSDFTDTINWYEKILGEYPHSDEELHALLDLAALYGEKLKNPAKATEYNQRAFNRYMDNSQIRDAIQSMIDAQYLTATAQFSEKNYKGTDEALDVIAKTYPLVFIQPETRAKIDSLADRSRRAQNVATASVDWIVLKNEIPFNKSYDQDFLPPVHDDQVMQSPDGDYLAERKRASNGNYYLYVAKISSKSDKALFNLIPQTIGAELPAWSPDGQDLVYWQTARKARKLQKTNVKSRITQTLFFTKSNSLGIHPAYHPAGNKIAYIYEGRVCLVNTGDTSYKQLLKTSQKLDYTADLAWSIDGTMIRCSQAAKNGSSMDELLVLDISAPTSP